MIHPRRSLLLAAALVSGVLSTTGCFAWQYDPEPVPTVLARQPSRVLIPIGADSFVVLLGAEVTNDSVVGLIEGSAEGGEQLTRFAAALSEVPRVARERLKLFSGAARAGDAAGKAIVPVGNYLAQLAILGGIILGTVGFGAYVSGAGH
jgi:hypothetical protein